MQAIGHPLCSSATGNSVPEVFYIYLLPMNILIIDDHDVILKGTIQAFQEKYNAPKITTALTANEARTKFSGLQDLDLIVLDLSLPNHANEQPTPNIGIELMKDFLKSESMPNILVLSTNIKPVVRLKALINAYGGGVTMMDKGQSTEDMLQMADISLRGSICWPQQVKGWLNKEAFRKEQTKEKALYRVLQVKLQQHRDTYF